MTAKRKGSIDCCICGDKVDLHCDLETGKVFWDQGHNAWPIKEGQCCDTCQWTVVFPTRCKMEERKVVVDLDPQTGPRFALEGRS